MSSLALLTPMVVLLDWTSITLALTSILPSSWCFTVSPLRGLGQT